MPHVGLLPSWRLGSRLIHSEFGQENGGHQMKAGLVGYACGSPCASQRMSHFHGLGARALTETWLGLIPGMCWCNECPALRHLCVVRTAGVALFTCRFIIIFVSLILQSDYEGVLYFMPGIRKHDVLKEKKTHTKTAFLLEFFLGWLKEKEVKVAWNFE